MVNKTAVNRVEAGSARYGNPLTVTYQPRLVGNAPSVIRRLHILRDLFYNG